MPLHIIFLSTLASHTRQLVTPKLVRIALMMAAIVCKMNFQVSFFFMVYLLSLFSGSPSLSSPSQADVGLGVN